jgi:hypothetical protein
MSRVGALHQRTVEACLDRQTRRAGRHLIAGHKIRTERSAAVEVLADRPLWRAELVVPNGSVIEDGIAGDMVKRICPGHMPCGPADNGDKLAFKIQRRRLQGPHNRLPVRDERRIGPEEDDREIGSGLLRLGGMILIIQAKTEDLPRLRNRRKQAKVDWIQRLDQRGKPQRLLDLPHRGRAQRKQRREILRKAGRDVGQRQNSRRRTNSQPFFRVKFVAYKSHGATLKKSMIYHYMIKNRFSRGGQFVSGAVP